MRDMAEQLEDMGFAEVTLGEQRDGDDLIRHVIEAVSPVD